MDSKMHQQVTQSLFTHQMATLGGTPSIGAKAATTNTPYMFSPVTGAKTQVGIAKATPTMSM